VFPVALDSMSTFIASVVYGDLSYLYVMVFLGLLFLITYKIGYFGLVAIPLTLFQGIVYLQTGDSSIHAWKIIVLFVSIPFFFYMLFEEIKS
jgi:hypothetical protein